MIKTDICIIDAGSSRLSVAVQCKWVLKLSCVKATILMLIIKKYKGVSKTQYQR